MEKSSSNSNTNDITNTFNTYQNICCIQEKEKQQDEEKEHNKNSLSETIDERIEINLANDIEKLHFIDENNLKSKLNENNLNETGINDNTPTPSRYVCDNLSLPPHIRNIPKTQSLDLVDERIEEDSSSSSNENTSNIKGMVSKNSSFDQPRPIFPNLPYSPFGSPCSSPRTARRRAPLRESRRISIEQSGSFLQLNQYKLLDQIGQVMINNLFLTLF